MILGFIDLYGGGGTPTIDTKHLAGLISDQVQTR